MKTLAETKKGLECCRLSCSGKCPYSDSLDCSDRLSCDALVYIQQLEQDNAQKDERIRQLEQLVPRWISVEERLPGRYTDVAIIERDGVHWWYKVAYLGACDVWALNGGHRVLGDVTHWMPLPEPPEEDA